MKVTFDRSLCAGHAQCWVLGPDIYELDDSGYLQSVTADVPKELEQQARSGADACPERAIFVED